ncbi:MAG: hypothetical protein U0132_23805 [Gemmatimonadaceae bacterium]
MAVPLAGGAMYAVSGTGVTLVVTSPTAPDPLWVDNYSGLTTTRQATRQLIKRIRAAVEKAERRSERGRSQ